MRKCLMFSVSGVTACLSTTVCDLMHEGDELKWNFVNFTRTSFAMFQTFGFNLTVNREKLEKSSYFSSSE